MPGAAAVAAALLLGAAGCFAPEAAQAESLRYCDTPAATSAAQQSRLLRVAALVRDVLAASGEPAALVSRAGLALSRFGQRYSHAGVALAAAPGALWSVRQLYFACDEGVPRLFDEGLSGFVMAAENPDRSFVSIVLLPREAALTVAARALDARAALRLLGARYSANAYPFDTRYQNCNQWLAELLAAAWGAPDDDADPRAAAQRWLREQGFEGTLFEAGALIGLVPFVPWVHRDGHPAEDLAAARFRVAMPASIEAFVRRVVPQARRVEICHDGARALLRRGWQAFDDACTTAPGDEVVALD